jgi:hypothetical protein
VPSVRVPALPKATTVLVPRRSITTADLTSAPCRPALATADSSGGIVAGTTAQGDAVIMKVIARKAHADAAASRDNAWLALLDLGTDGHTRELQPLDLSHDERYLG